MFDGTTGAKVYGDRIELHFVDGGRGDADLIPNGEIVGPGSPGLVAKPWQNPILPEDVNNDGSVTPLDALLLIGEINDSGPRELPAIPTGNDSIPPYWDASGDDQITSLDVLLVIDLLNDQAGGEGESARDGLGVSTQASAMANVEDPPSLLVRDVFLLTNTASPIVSAEPGSWSPEPSFDRPSVEPTFGHVADRPVFRQMAATQASRPPIDECQSPWLLTDSDLETALSAIAEDISDVWGQSASV